MNSSSKDRPAEAAAALSPSGISASIAASAGAVRDGRRAAWGVVVGSALEWYDFFLYSLLAGSVIANNFFPVSDPFAASVAAYGSFALGFLARPFGGLLLANLSDRFGRKRILAWILFLTGGSSFLIGVLPGYAAIGLPAPLILLLLRLLQGVGAGAEFAVAAVYAVESGTLQRSGLRGALPAMGVYGGMLLASAVLAVFSNVTGPHFAQWGWRVPFLFSGVLLGAGYWVRHNLRETAAFEQLAQDDAAGRRPVLSQLRAHWRGVIFVIGAQCAQAGLGFLYLTFTGNYLTQTLGLPRQVALTATLVAAAVAVVTAPVFGALADRVGVRRFFVAALFFCVGADLVYFPLINTRSPVWINVAMILTIGVAVNALLAVQGALFTAQFPASVRASGVALGRELSTAVVGGLTPLAAILLLRHHGTVGVTSLALALTVISIVTVVCKRR